MRATRNPSYRAGIAKDFLLYLERLHPGSLSHLRTVVPGVMATLDACARTDWVSIDVDGLRVTEIVRYLGADPARDLWRRFTREGLIRSPAIRAVSDGVVRVHGRSLPSCLKSIPLIFHQSWRECGAVEVVWGERGARLTITHMPPPFAVFPAYALLFEGVFLALYDLATLAPQLDYGPELAAGRIEALFRW